jgi:hypothetical protein
LLLGGDEYRPAAHRVQMRCRRLRRRQRTGLIDVSGYAASLTTYQESPDVQPLRQNIIHHPHRGIPNA